MGNGMAELATTFAVRETGGIRCGVEGPAGSAAWAAVVERLR